MQASGNIVEVDILELSRFPCCGVDIFCTSIRLVLMMMKEIDLKLTQQEWLRGNKLSLRLMRNHGERVGGSNLGQTQSHFLSESGRFLSNRSQDRLFIARMLNKDPKIFLPSTFFFSREREREREREYA